MAAKDKEPSLGGLGMNAGNQALWATGANDDREDEHDGTEPPEDDEPSLGSFDRLMSQVDGWKQRNSSYGGWWTPGADHEFDPAERGIADQEALDERRGGYV